MNLLGLIAQALQNLWGFVGTIWQSLGNVLHFAACMSFKEYLTLMWSITSALPLPDWIRNPSLPTVGPIGYALTALGIPQAMAIVSTAFTVKMTLRLIPFIGH